jgi:hypothetical protein
MKTAREKVREELLLDAAAGDELPITAVDHYVKQLHPSASVSEVQSETLATIRSLARDGLVVLGAMSGEDGRWENWNEPVDMSMQRIADLYVPHYDDPPAWVFSSWIRITDKGREAARALEASSN